MENPFTFLIICLIVLILFLAGVVALAILMRPTYFFETAFPKQKPSWAWSWSRDSKATDVFIMYYGVRLLALCVGLFVVLALAKRWHLL